MFINYEKEGMTMASEHVSPEKETGKARHGKKPEKQVQLGKTKKKGRGRIALGVVMSTFGAICLVLAILINSMLARFGSSLDNATFLEEDTLKPDYSGYEQDDLIDYTPEDLSKLEVRGNNDYVTNYLLIGCDSRSGERARSDTNIILSINDKTKTIKLVSILRDTWVYNPGLGGYDRINAAFMYAGFDGLLSTVESNFCLDIDQAVMVDFNSFASAVDALGGIDVDVDEAAASWIPKEDPHNPDSFAKSEDGIQIREPIGYEAGNYHLAGFQALAFCRLRYIYADSDISRQRNQRRVISGLIKTAMQNPTKIFNVLDAVLADVTLYRISKGEILSYVDNATKYLGYKIEMDYEFTYQNMTTAGGAMVLTLPDQEQQLMNLHEYLYGEGE